MSPDERMLTVKWTETIMYQSRLTVAEAREILVVEYRADLTATHTPDQLAELLSETDLDDWLSSERGQAYADRPEYDVEWIKVE